jgi:hypothetical protein
MSFIERLGFRTRRTASPGAAESTYVSVPYWFLALLAAAAPLWKWRAVARQRRLQRLRQKGICLNCGYDLRASPERCPECGTIPSREMPRPHPA